MKKMFITATALALSSCSGMRPEQPLLVRTCNDGTHVYVTPSTGALSFSSTFVAGDVAPGITADQVCSGNSA